ncbi:hypothetical protein HK099_004552 [Clydaea vesicula]|uniref:Uncharacterized protein n=1 Tax=Clydaea vesicula TaxID=447962 RepID=A0AAD5U0J3_9FUNG|nr:hypothetical protein HK099_004552 [Clydaea vesicula]
MRNLPSLGRMAVRFNANILKGRKYVFRIKFAKFAINELVIGMDYNHVLQKLMKFPSKLVIPSWQFIQMAIENKNLYAEKSFSQLNSPVIEGNLLPSPQNPQPQPVTKTFSFPSVSPSYPSSKEENKYQPENSQLHQEQISFLHDKLEGIEKRDKILINTINSVTEELGQLDNEDSETVEVSKSKINLMLKKLENCVQIITKYEEKESKGSAQNFEEKSWFGKVASVDEIRSGVDPELAKDFSKFTSSSTTELNDTSTKLVASVASVATSVTAGLKKWGVF